MLDITVQGSQPLVIFAEARRQIDDATTTDQVNRILALATGLAAAARQASDKEMEAEAEVLRFEAERRLGQLMEAQKTTIGFNEGAKGSRVKGARVSDKPTLAEAGIDKNLANRARKACAVAESEVEEKKQEIRVGVSSKKPRKLHRAKAKTGIVQAAKTKTETAAQTAVSATQRKHPSDWQLAQFKGAVDTYLPKMNADDKQQALAYVSARVK
jgi:hypothetical protein